MELCPCCHQRVAYAKDSSYNFADVCFKDGVFANDLPERLAWVTFSDGAKMIVSLELVTPEFLRGVVGADAKTKVTPVSFKF